MPFVAEFLDDSGLGSAVAVDAEGVPSVSYWIFPAELEEGEIPVGRPIGAPYIVTDDHEPQEGAAIGVASLSADNVFTRGAAAQVHETPTRRGDPVRPGLRDLARRRDRRRTRTAPTSRSPATARTSSGRATTASSTPAVPTRSRSSGSTTTASTCARPVRSGRAAVTADGDGEPVGRLHHERRGDRRFASPRGRAIGGRPRPSRRCPKCSRLPAAPAHRHRRDLRRPDGGLGRHRRRRRHGLDARGRRVGRHRGGGGGERAGSRHGGRRRRQRGCSRSTTARAACSSLGRPEPRGRSRRSPTPQPADPEAVGNLAPSTSVAIDDEGGIVAAWDDADGVRCGDERRTARRSRRSRRPTRVGGRSPSVGVSPDGRERLRLLVRPRRREPSARGPRRRRASSRWRRRARRPTPARRRHPRPSPTAAGAASAAPTARSRSTSWPRASPGTRRASWPPRTSRSR